MNIFSTRILCLAILVACAFAPAAQAKKLTVFVSILPQKYFVEQIAKDLADVTVMVQPGASPATYEPKPGQMTALSKAALYFAIGVPFEDSWLARISSANPGLTVIHTDRDIEKIPMAHHDHSIEEHHNQEAEGRDEHEGNHHDDQGLDPHIWLSPELVKIQAEVIFTALKTIDPSHQSVYETNYNDFSRRLEILDKDLHDLFKNRKGFRFMVFHPSWGYFAKNYDLVQVPIEIEGKNPKPAQLKELIKDARKSNISVIFVQPQFSTRNAKLIAREINGRVIFADPLSPDWMTNMKDVAQKFMEAAK